MFSTNGMTLHPFYLIVMNRERRMRRMVLPVLPASGRLHGHLRAGCHQPGDRVGTAYMDSIPLVAITGQVPAI
jgi:hypothetical protein